MKTTISTKNYQFCFKEASADEYLDYIKCGKEYGIILYVNILQGKKVKATYRKEYDKEVNHEVINNFINKFMFDATYRLQFLIEGENITEIQENTGPINESCKQAIQRISNTREESLNLKIMRI